MPRPFLFDEDAEMYVVGSIMVDDSWIGQIDLSPSDFYFEKWKYLFETELAITIRGEHVDELNLTREASPVVDATQISYALSQIPTSLDCDVYAKIIKNLSQKRQLNSIIEAANTLVESAETMTAVQIADSVRAKMDELRILSDNSRYVTFSNPVVVTSSPPTYNLTVTTLRDGASAEIRFTSGDLDQPAKVKRKIRERLNINPVLPKGFDSLIHSLLVSAQMEVAPVDSSLESRALFWVREWFKSAIEAEEKADLQQGYVERSGALWFVKERMLNYLREKAKISMQESEFWPLLHAHGGRYSKVVSVGGAKVRLWGIDKSFFDEELESADEEQLELKGEEAEKTAEEDLSWLEK